MPAAAASLSEKLSRLFSEVGEATASGAHLSAEEIREETILGGPPTEDLSDQTSSTSSISVRALETSDSETKVSTTLWIIQELYLI